MTPIRVTPGPTIPLVLASVLIVVLLVIAAASRSAALPDSPPDAQPSGAPSHGGALSLPLATNGMRPASSGEPVAASTPTGSIGTALEVTRRKGWATWCAPTANHCQSWGGDAYVGAVRSFHDGDDPYAVNVCLVSEPTRCTTVVVLSFCACGKRKGEATVIDLSPAAFRELAPLSRGVIRVTVEGPIPVALPPTDATP